MKGSRWASPLECNSSVPSHHNLFGQLSEAEIRKMFKIDTTTIQNRLLNWVYNPRMFGLFGIIRWCLLSCYAHTDSLFCCSIDLWFRMTRQRASYSVKVMDVRLESLLNQINRYC